MLRKKYNTIKRHKTGHILKKLTAAALCFAVLVTGAPVQPAKAAIKIYYPDTKKTVTYTKTLVNYRYDNVVLDLRGIKGILTDNGVAMGPYYDLFVKALGVSCNKNGKELTFKKGNNTLVLTVGSNTAVLNGVSVKMSAAPVSMRFPDIGITQIMVPTRFVAESLGFAYRFDSAESTAIIQDHITLLYNGKQVSYIGAAGKVTVDGKKVNVSNLPVLLFKGTAMLRAYNVFSQAMGVDYSYHEKTGKIIFKKGSLTLQMQENSTTAYLNGRRLDCGVAPVMVTNQENSVTSLLVPGRFVAESLGYHYEWNSSTKTSQITTTDQVGIDKEQMGQIEYSFAFYKEWQTEFEEESNIETSSPANYLLEIDRGINDNGAYLCFQGLYPSISYELSKENDLSLIYFTNISNSFEEVQLPEKLLKDYFDYAEMYKLENGDIRFAYKPANEQSVTLIENLNKLYLYFNYYEKEGEQKQEEERKLEELQNISILLPEEIPFSDVVSEDRYWEKKIVFAIPGEYKDYYQENPVINPYPAVKDISVTEKDGSTEIILSTSRILGYAMQKEENGFSVRLGDPSEIYKKIVVLDAGHGGSDPGAQSGGYNEKDINFEILYNYARTYFEKSDIKVYFSRRTDTKVDLYERASFASEVEADIFVSLHMNAHNSSSANGTSVYYSTMNTSITSGGLNSQTMAAALADSLSQAMKTNNRGVYTENFVVVRMTRMPAVLIELAFITNSRDRRIITTASKQKAAAKTIFNTVVGFFETYPTER